MSPNRRSALFLSPFVWLVLATGSPSWLPFSLGRAEAPSASQPPSHAAAHFTPGAGRCIEFLSVYVPARGGSYAVGVSFAYRDMNRDGSYTPGVDKLDVCVNCSDACDWGP